MRGCFKISIICCATLIAASSYAVNLDQGELKRMQDYAAVHGTVPVVVSLHSMDLKNLPNEKAQITEKVAGLESAFLKEVGSGAAASGRRSNGFGQLTLHLNPRGLASLAKSKIALSAWRGTDWIESSRLNNSDGALSAIDKAFEKSSMVKVEIVPDVDDLAYRLSSDGSVNILENSKMTDSLNSFKQSISDALISVNGASKQASLANRFSSSAAYGKVVLDVSREELIELVSRKNIRKIKLVNYLDGGSTNFDSDLDALIKKNGKVTALFTLNNSLAVGGFAKNAIRLTSEANIQAVGDVSARWFAERPPGQIWSRFGAFSMEIDAEDLKRIKSSPDKRVLSVDANKPVASLSLATSTSMLHMQTAWGAGLTGAGQTIFFLDSGIQKSHPFLKDAAGNSRVVHEACFGSIEPGQGFDSPCPPPLVLGDSQPGIVGSGDLIPSNLCPTIGGCDHGTHVAGVATGRNEPGAPSGVQGIAYGANIVSLRVSSVPFDKTQSLRSFHADIAAAMDYILSLAEPTPHGSVMPYVVNISQAADYYPGPPCSVMPGLQTAVYELDRRGIPVIAGSGNGEPGTVPVGRRYGIAWPSCVPGVIGVGAVNNDGAGAGSGITTWAGSNLANPAYFDTKTFLMAPGAPVTSSVPGGYGSMSGTSQAAPHVAGMYAVVKSWQPTLNNEGVTNLIKGSAVTYYDTVCDNSNTPGPINNCVPAKFYRIQLP